MRTFLLVLFAVTVACATGDPSPAVPVDSFTLERRGERVFRELGIPVAERDLDGRVESGWFAASELWGPATLRDRVDCGLDREGEPRAVGRRVELTVTLRVVLRGRGTAVAVESDGRTLQRSELDPAHRCVLKESFARQVEAAVVGERLRAGAGAGASAAP